MKHLVLESNLRGRTRLMERPSGPGKTSLELLFWLLAILVVAGLVSLLIIAFTFPWSRL